MEVSEWHIGVSVICVLTTVIGHEREKGWVIVDAGWMAMSRDRGTARQDTDQGYGLVCSERGEVIDGTIMVSANQEHGIIARHSDGKDLSKELPVGTRLRILPNHPARRLPTPGISADRNHQLKAYGHALRW